jgi:hypothetical protein
VLQLSDATTQYIRLLLERCVACGELFVLEAKTLLFHEN